MKLETSQALLKKSEKSWVVEWIQPCAKNGLYQITKPMNRNDGKKFLRLLRHTLHGDFFHEVKGNRFVPFPI
jgi:hypothetical protein